LSEENEAEAAAARLEQALERIAALAAQPLPAVANPPESEDQAQAGEVDVAALTHRLDTLIAQLRGALAS
jgi:hypothetical protein